MPETSAYSTCGAIQNLWLAARAEGIGVGWVSILEPQALRAILGIPARVAPIAYLCLGHVDSFPDRPTLETAGWLPRLPLGELVFGGAWGQPAAPALAAAIAHEVAPRPAPAAPPTGRGLLLVYTGQGKGKTTAALGLVFRAMGRGLPVAVVQFIKGKWKTGERMFAETLPELTFLVMGQGFTWDSDDLSRDRNAAIAAWERSKQLIAAGDHSLVVLDELTYAINYGFLDGAEVIAALATRPPHVHVVITGRQAPEALCAAADLVTEMTSPKHPFQQGHKAALGIDY
ncbi:MAG: cob(I)yrinic acid a,c-diamide adenosyltransferase [Deltaproteobacteria bacterium]|nr:cob(I)yrinic acid a,c-diamide adenosyltransferase [Deltaproteobacteria bacterium]